MNYGNEKKRRKGDVTLKKTPGYFIWDNILAMSAYWACSGTIISSLSEYFGLSLALSNLIIGFTTILPIVQLAGGMAYGHAKNPLTFLRLSGGVWRLFLPAVFFSVLLPKSIGSIVMIISYMLAVGIYQYSASPQISWMSSCVDHQVSQSYYAHREMLFMAAYTVLFCVVSLTIDRTQKSNSLKEGFIGIGIVITILMVASLIVLFKIPAPPTDPKKAPALQELMEPFHDPVFRRVIICNMIWNVSYSFIGSFSSVYQVQVLKLSFVLIMIWVTVSNIARTLFTPLMACLAKRIGWRNVTAFCAFIMAVASVIWAANTRENMSIMYPVAIIMSTIPYAGINVGFLNMQIMTSPEESRSVYVSVLALLNGVGALVGSLICSFLLHKLEAVSPSAPRLIFYAGTFCTLAAMAAILRVSDKKRAQN